MKPRLFTIGHSNQPLDHLLALLAQHGIATLVDIRRFPSSRKFPQFNQNKLASAFQKAGIEYHWLEALGGRRGKKKGDSPNLGLENEGFRYYADYMQTQEFRAGIDNLLEIADRKKTAIMCAEAVFWRCH